MNKVSKAKSIFRKLVKTIEGKDPEIMDHYGDILYSCKKYSLSVVYWNEAMKQVPGEKERLMKKIEMAEDKMR